MGTSQAMKNCKNCGKMTLHIQKSTSHVLHLLLSIITAGLWIIPWILIAASNGSVAQCSECGKRKGLIV